MSFSINKRTIRGVHLLRLKGTAGERARAHGAMLKEEVLRGAMPALAMKNETLIRRGPGLIEKFPPLREAMVWFYRQALIPYLEKQVDPKYRDMLVGMAEAVGLPYEVCREGLFQPEAMMLLSRTTMMKYVLRDMPRGVLPGCSSAVAYGAWTKSGRLLACRNQDYPVVGAWEPNTTVLFHEPTEPGEIPHVALTTAGVHTAGLTSMNREGLTLFLHAHFGRRVSTRGRPVVAIGDEIISKARTLNEAIDIAKKSRRFGNWSFIVCSARENESVVIEMDMDKTYVRHAEDGYLAHSNYFHSKELQKSEALLSGGCTDDVVSRVCRLREVLEENRGRLEPEHFAQALGDHVDPKTGVERIYGNTVSVVTTIKSGVFEPETQTMWVSTRPESPTGLGEFIELGADRFWSVEGGDRSETRVIQGYRPKDPELLEGVRMYREAYRAWHMSKGDWRAAADATLIALRKAVRAYPRDGNVWVQAGLFAFKLGNLQEAAIYFQEARDRILSEHTRHVCDLYAARCMDVLGNRAGAKEIYRNYRQVKEPKLRKAFRVGLIKKYRATRFALSMIALDLQFPDSFEY